MGEEAASADGRRFVIQEHHATRLHWDLRLEHDGVLVSFAIPNGLPEAPKDNRLAVHTEDHPLEYLEFEGEIPKGQYGAGTMRVWDRGTYEVLKWEPRKIEVLPARRARAGALRALPDRQGRGPQELDDPPHGPARRRGGGEPMPEKIVPMMARTGTLPRDDEHWAFEVKWDGVRAVCHSEPGRMRLHSRNLLDITPRYPEVGRLNRALSHHRAVLDGEIVALDAEGRPSFGALQRRMHVGSESRRPAAGQGDAGHLRHLRPAVARRALAHGAALQRAPRAPGRARARRRRALARARLRRRPRRAAAGGHRAAGPRGRHRQAPGLDLRARAAHAVLAEDQEHVAPGGRRRRLGAGRRQAPRPHRRAAGRACATTTAACATSGASAPASPRPSSIAWPRSCARWSARTRRSRPAARRSRAARCSPIPSWWPRSSSASGPTAASCARPPTRACATTSRPSSSCARRPTPSWPRSAGARSSSRTSTRSSIPRPASPSATSSTTSRASRRPSCRTSRAAR